MSKGSLYLKNVDDKKKCLNKDELNKLITNHKLDVAQIFHQSKNIIGTAAYKKAARGRLFAMIDQIGLPTMFCTFSSADMYWKDVREVLNPHCEKPLIDDEISEAIS